MFKPLLRTLPSLSGNFTLACKLNEIKKETSDKFYTYVRVADLMPLQNNMFKKNIELNLLNGKYEHDIKKYYSVYSNVFYKENFNYSRNNYKTLDLFSRYNEVNDDRNKDYEFGCKRIYYSKVGYQFSFYAPFYLDSIDDLPESFVISININDHIEKEIKIYINKENKINYLKSYFDKYFENVDEKVIFCLYDSLQASYFGVDVRQGGFAQYKDNIFGSLYVNQTTINNFDNIICKGFERNNLIMSQIIPLSFMFNINDLFNEYEKEFFLGYKMKITGFYFNKNGIKQDMYDFDINYFDSDNIYYKYNPRKAIYEYSTGDNDGPINVMNVGYPALNESKYVKYEFTNKISPNYCKFKMLLSDDADPYITNVNFAYSYIQYPNQKYGYFPTTFKGISPKLIYLNGDIKLPTGLNIDNYYNTSKYFANTVVSNSVNYDKFIKLMENYCSSWFNIYEENNFEEVFNNDDYWADIMYDYAYLNGILYNLYELKKYDISKFGVFFDYNINCISDSELNNMVKAKYVFSNSDVTNSAVSVAKFNTNYDLSIYDPLIGITYYNKLFNNVIYNNNNVSYLHYDKVMEKNLYGKYILEENYVNENKYYLLSDIIKIIDKSIYPIDIKNKIKKYLNINKVVGYILLDAYNNINYFETYFNEFNEKKIRLILIDELFETSEIDARYEWLYNRLYYSTSLSTQKIKLASGYKNLSYNEDSFGKFCLYLEDSFINAYDIYFILTDISSDTDLNESLYSRYNANSSEYSNVINEIDNELNERLHIVNLTLNDVNDALDRISDLESSYNVNNEDECLDALEEITGHRYQNAWDGIQQAKSKCEARKQNLNSTIIEINNLINGDKTNLVIEKINKLIRDEISNMHNNFISQLSNNSLSKYMFERIGTVNGIDVENYFKDIKKEEDQKTIYVDSYNLKYIIKKFNKENKSNLKLSSNKKEYFIKLINKDHIKEYYYNLNKDENCITNTEYDNLLEFIYVKERKWIIYNDSIKIKDVYCNLYTYIVKYLVSYDKDDEDMNESLEFIYEMLNADNQTVYDWIYSNLSDTRSINNKFKLNIASSISLDVDLCFKKSVYQLNDDLCKIIANDSSINNYLYLYIEDECINENMSTMDIISPNYVNSYNSNIEYKDWENKKYSKKLYEKEINDYLIPLFTDIYINDANKETLYNMMQMKKIVANKYIINNGKYFKEIDIDSTLLKIYEDKSYLINDLYSQLYHTKLPNTIEETIEKLILNDSYILYFMIIRNFGSKFELPSMSKIQFKTIMTDSNSSVINNRINDLVEDITAIIKNTTKQKALDEYLYNASKRFGLSSNVYNSFMSEYCINNNINLDTISTNELIRHKLSYLKEQSLEAYYTLIKENKITLYSMKDTLSISFDKIGIDNDNLTYDSDYNMYIYNKDGIKYAFYFISINIDNTNYSFNILDDFNLNIKFNTINSNDINNKIFMNSIFHILYPFLKINVFGEFVKRVSTIVYPNELEIYIKYVSGNQLTADEAKKYVKYITNSKDILYKSLDELKVYKKIKLLRYFNYITPLLKRTDVIYDDWYLKFMESDPNYNDIHKNNILDIRNTSIYKYPPLTVYYKEYDLYEYDFKKYKDPDTGKKKYYSYEINQIEYKHYNDNVIFNLPEKIVFYDKKKYKEQELNKLLKLDDKLTNNKINILYNFFRKNGLDYDDIKLFLYNKYESSFFIEKTNGECKIKYIFTLI